MCFFCDQFIGFHESFVRAKEQASIIIRPRTGTFLWTFSTGNEQKRGIIEKTNIAIDRVTMSSSPSGYKIRRGGEEDER